jgi:hypothetical protein
MSTTSGVDVVNTFINAVETQNRDAIKQLLSGDFVARGWSSQPLNKGQFLDLLVALKKALPEQTFTLQKVQEDKQFAQSDRIDAMLCLVDTHHRGDGGSASTSLEPISFTIMGSMIESMVIAPTRGGELERTLKHLITEPEHPDEQSRLTGNQSDEEQGQALYEKQSNLYDPKGKSYTPSRGAPDYAPQVDASAIAHQKKEDAETPLFESWQEQIELTSRQPDRQSEEQQEQ